MRRLPEVNKVIKTHKETIYEISASSSVDFLSYCNNITTTEGERIICKRLGSDICISLPDYCIFELPEDVYEELCDELNSA